MIQLCSRTGSQLRKAPGIFSVLAKDLRTVGLVIDIISIVVVVGLNIQCGPI